MRITDQADFDSAPEDLLAAFTDRDYFRRKYRRLDGGDVEIESCEDDGERFVIAVRRHLPPAGPLPGFVRKLVGNRIAVTQTDTWHRSRQCGRIDILVHAAPVAVGVDLDIGPRDTGSRLSLDYEVDVRVPLLRGRLERFLAEDIVRRTRDDLDVTRQLLEEGS